MSDTMHLVFCRGGQHNVDGTYDLVGAGIDRWNEPLPTRIQVAVMCEVPGLVPGEHSLDIRLSGPGLDIKTGGVLSSPPAADVGRAFFSLDFIVAATGVCTLDVTVANATGSLNLIVLDPAATAVQ